ncbi:nodulation protein L [Colletotrichum orchidophilum]|uniref:Nodulation protein L n=1 Tax=Colletotrichum orchidophilum TaxID=1209926 RepID=A0A1G4B617_9PEZI|nr:nodulation protein L [Colletotrichum orchidophilum]OHE96857.1 nodulation protein L [Colletotrichum orchidophilum]
MGAKKEKDLEILELMSSIKDKPSCENYERMVSGMMYDPLDPILSEGRHRARCLTREFNEIDHRKFTFQEVGKKKKEILQRMLGKLGEGSFIEAPLSVNYGCNVFLGKDSFISFKYVFPALQTPYPCFSSLKNSVTVLINYCSLTILDVSVVSIGDRVHIGPNVGIYSATHDASILSRLRCREYGLRVTIEDDCWIGGGSIILPGVTIGFGTTVGAGSVVTKSLPSYSLAVGNPAKVIKKVQTVEEEMSVLSSFFED